LRVRRTGGTGPRAGLRDVARPGRRPAHRARVARRVLARIAAAVALIERARIAVVGARGPTRLLRLRRTRGTRTRAGLRPVALRAVRRSPARTWSPAPHRPAAAQRPAPGRRPSMLFASAGQVALVPVQASATSHAPAAGRHTVPAWPAGCWHASLLPSH